MSFAMIYICMRPDVSAVQQWEYRGAREGEVCGFHTADAQDFRYFETYVWAWQCSRYSDCLRAGRSGDRILVEARFSAPVQTCPEAHPAFFKMGTGSFPGLRCYRGVTLNPHPLLVQRSKIEQSYTSTLPKGLRGL